MTEPGTIAVVGGTGAEGRGLAARFASAGLPVLVGSRETKRASSVVSALIAERGPLPLEAAVNGDAIQAAGTIILAVPFGQVDEVIEVHRERFRPGSLVIDVTVPVVFEAGRARLLDVPEGSAAEHVRRMLPPDVRVAATFKTLPATLLRGDARLDCDEFVCGDSDEARERTIDLVRSIPGLRPLDAGQLDSARTIERMSFLAITLNQRYKSRDARFRVIGIPGEPERM
jgi:NADPH-dependent F420 reductase